MLHTSVRPDDHLSYYHYRAQVLTQMGDLDGAEQIAHDLMANLPESWHRQAGFSYIMGCVELARNRPEQAIEHFGALPNDSLRYPVMHLAGRALLAAGRPHEAIDELETFLRPYERRRLLWSTLDISAHYYLAMSYESVSDFQRAIAEYQTLLDAWGDAEPMLPLVEDARSRLRRLEESS
jgi:predicted Zn-dependent protease